MLSTIKFPKLSQAISGVLFVLLGFSGVSQKAISAAIIQDQSSGTNQIKAFSPIGQTFTAEDSSIYSIGFYVEDFNPSFAPNDFTLTVSLYEGIGIEGNFLGKSSNIYNLTNGYSGWVDTNFSSVALNVGESYTAILEDDTVRWGVQVTYDVYSGGFAIAFNEPTNADLRFRVLTSASQITAPVPEPVTISGTLLAGGIGLMMKRNKSKLA